MTLFVASLCGVLGLAIGSFLNVVVHRVPAGLSVVSPPSACPRCRTPIRPRDNVPVLGWVLLRGRCRDCALPISPRYPLVEAGCAALFAALGARFGADPVLPAFLYLAAVGLALSLIDLDTRRLPDVLVLPSYVVMVVLLAVPVVVGEPREDFLRALAGGAAAYAAFFALCFAYPNGMGFGDVKLSGVLGLGLAQLGWGELVLGLFAGFLLGGVVGVALLARGTAGRKTAVPFGPFMVVGTFLAVFAGGPLVDGYLGLLSP